MKLFKVKMAVSLSLNLTTGYLLAQITFDDYRRADSIILFNNLVYHQVISPEWIDSTYYFWYKTRTQNGEEYVMVNSKKKSKYPAFDQQKLCSKIKLKTGKQYNAYGLPLSNVSFSKDLKVLKFELDSFIWKCDLKNYDLNPLGKVNNPEEGRYWGESINELTNKPVLSPDSIWYAYIKDYNVFIMDRKSSREYQLSYDGSEGDFYSSYIVWSPDSKKIATNKIRDNKKRYIYFIESSPENQIQPVLHKREYLKPGDALPIKRPALFDIVKKCQISVQCDNFLNQYDISNISWRKDSRSFTFEFNQRGHQVYQVIEVNGSNGEVKVLIDERSNTFIDYSSKKFRYDVNDGQEIIWASERDGWNHLYLFDGQTGALINQITKGEWVVRGVEYVDEKHRQIIFRGSGINPNEDPYFVHYYRINFDGSGLTDLTPEPANHHAFFSADYKYFIDSYSTVSQPPIAKLRSASENKIIMELENADISELLSKGWKSPEVFVAKGRDGVTDIWGNIYKPWGLDTNRLYPIIEYIYAGPHSSFVQKDFLPVPWFSCIAQLGFIVVQIDGMGTSNRSKAFHDICWRNLKDAGFPDRILWIRAAARIHHFMDTARVGIFGTSAGGQNALAALLFHPEFYKVSVSSCGCHDNRMDKIWWNEQFMGFPVGPHYAECSNVEHASNLRGKLLLIVGEMDDNVDPSSTMQVVNALIKANKEFELLVLPGENHTSGGKYGERKRRDFFIKNLSGIEPPQCNQIGNQ